MADAQLTIIRITETISAAIASRRLKILDKCLNARNGMDIYGKGLMDLEIATYNDKCMLLVMSNYKIENSPLTEKCRNAIFEILQVL